MPALNVPTKFSAADKISPTLNRMSSRATKFGNKAKAGFARAQRQVRKLDKSTGSLSGNLTNLQGAFAGVFAVAGGTQLASSIESLAKMEGKISTLFGVGQKEAQKYATKVDVLASKHGQSREEILSAANAVTKQLDVSYEKAFKKINAGFNKGADVQGEFISQLKEYPAQFKAMGLSADKALGLITQTQRKGVFSDKGVDAMKEATTALREMPKPAKEAVNKLFESNNAAAEMQKRLNQGDTTFFAEIQRISSKLKETDKQTKGMVLANIFKGAGEDAGAFISEIGKMSPSLKKLEDTRNETAKGFDRMTTLFVKLKNVLLRSLVPAFNESFAAMKPVGKWMVNNQSTVKALVKTVLAGVAAFLLFKTTLFVLSTAFKIASASATAFNVVQGITKALAGGSAFSLRKSRAALIAYNVTTKIATGVQAAFNAVLAANPISLVIAGIVALIAVVAIIIKKWKSWGAALSILFGPLGFIISLIQSFRRNWDMLVKAFQQNGIIGAIKAIGVIILDALLMPVQQLLELAGKLPTWLGGTQATNAAGAIKELRKNIKGMQEDAKKMQDGQQPQQAQQTNPRAAQRENERRVVQESRENVRLDINDPRNLTQINRAQGGRRTRLQIGKTTAQ